ncbi:MAG: hypothetical protein RSD47_10425 [Romboutsia sp.]
MFYIVFQRNFKQQYDGGFIWAPIHDVNGNKQFSWNNLLDVEKEDIIFSINNQNIVSVNTISKTAYPATRPAEFGKVDLIDSLCSDGYMVNLNYNLLVNKIRPKDYINDIALMLPSKYSPFKKNGNGNFGLLYKVPDKLGNYLLDKIISHNPNIAKIF